MKNWKIIIFIIFGFVCFLLLYKQINISQKEKSLFEYLKIMQDISSQDKKLLPSMEDNITQTFNNSLGAICFILKNERERAERILDFYSNATKIDNIELKLQNFFYQGEARGFYQYVLLNKVDSNLAYYTPWNNDRWIGDMAWLLIAYKYYEKKYSSNKYHHVSSLLKDLLMSFYKDSPDGVGGYVQHGWRKGDVKRHEVQGHHEGNIDCYAALKLCGEDGYADKIKIWLDNNIKGNNLPLDLYAWRVLSLGKSYADILRIPEQDKRYKKEVSFNDKKVIGFFSFTTLDINNIWVDGTAHMACAYDFIGNDAKYSFYKKQLEKMLIKRVVNGKFFYSLPYTLNKEGGYDWVDIDKGFISCVIWYIFVKEKFNPFILKVNN